MASVAALSGRPAIALAALGPPDADMDVAGLREYWSLRGRLLTAAGRWHEAGEARALADATGPGSDVVAGSESGQA